MKKLSFLVIIVVFYITVTQQHNSIPLNSGVVYAQTVPTRTPTPPPTTKPPTSNPQPTNTAAPPTATPTETPIPVTIGPTPMGGFSPTAESCSNTPTVQVRNNTNVRLGPGTDYDVVGQLVYLEVRPILGRAQNAQWWYIALADGTTGFVFDDVVAVSGYTDIVPIVPAPELDGSTPTPGPQWNPTPNPGCTVTPTPLPTDTPISTATGTAVSPTETPTLVAQTTRVTTPTPLPTDTAVPPTETPTLVAQPARVTTPTPLPTAVPLEEPTTGSNSNWLLFGVGGLLAIAITIFVIRRR